ncbi:MAG TPA: glycosyltransferase [bacterium]
MKTLLFILILAFLVYFATVVFLLTGLLRTHAHVRPQNRRVKVSIVVAARNEAPNIETCLQALAQQTYPREQMQIIIVDDRSEDHTYELAKRFREKCDSEMIIERVESTPEGMSPKKYALSRGIELANGEIVFTTDADCVPPPEWLAEMVPQFSENVGMLIGAAPFERSQNALQKLLSLDNMATALVAAGSAGWNVGVTCTGRNLAYRKAVYEEVGGFAPIQKSLSGDDDLFLQLVSQRTSWQIRYSLKPKTAVPSRTVSEFSDFIRQRRRHVSAAKYYAHGIKACYFLFNLSNLILFAFLVYGVWRTTLFPIAVILFSSKLTVDFLALFLMTRKFDRTNLLSLFLIWEVFFLFNQVVISPLGFVGKIRWK